MSATVSALALAPVKGMRLASAATLELGPAGARGDRAFCVVDEHGALLLTTRTPRLLQVEPAWDGTVLALRFPDGTEVAEEPALGARATTANYAGRPIAGRLVGGALSAAVAEHLGRPWWRTAINTEAKLLLIGHAFETLRANRVALKTDIRNERSQAAIARLGAVREGVLRHQYIRRDGTLRDSVMYSIIPAEWPAVKANLRARLAAHG